MAKLEFKERVWNDMKQDLRDMKGKALDLSPVLEAQKEKYENIPKNALENSTSPDGTPFPPLSLATLSLRNNAKRNSSNSTKPLLATGRLFRQIRSKVENKNSIVIEIAGDREEIGKIQHFGAPGNRLPRGKPAPIPSRAFMPINDAGESEFPDDLIEETVNLCIDHIFQGWSK